MEHVCGCASVRGECKLFTVLAGFRRWCLSTKAAAFLFALHRMSLRPMEQACGCSSVLSLECGLRCETDAKCVPCLAGTRTSFLPAKAAAFLYALY